MHILSYLVLAARKHSDPVTSQQVAQSARTNPVVIRRLLGLLRKRGLVPIVRVVDDRRAPGGLDLAAR